MAQNKVVLMGHFGGDKTHCLSAWQSTGLQFDYTKSINSRIDLVFSETVKTKQKTPQELLTMLASQGHHTPFEISTLYFQVTADLATHIHCIKHRIGVSINGESARYKELEDKWYIPDDWDVLAKVSPCTNGEYTWAEELDSFLSYAHELYHEAIEQLTPVLGRKRAKESARYFLPYAKQLDFNVQFNFRSFMHFHGLRGATPAQKEVQKIAQSMLEQVRAIPGEPFKYSLEAFGY